MVAGVVKLLVDWIFYLEIRLNVDYIGLKD